MDYRALPEAHREAFHEIASYAFAPESGPDFEDRDEDRDEHRRRLREDRAVYDADADTPTEALDADDVRAICGYHDFRTRLRGAWHAVGGVSAVASPPETRRRGHVAFMLDELLAEFREEGMAFSVLWPFEYAFYRRFGWALTGSWQELSISPGDLAGSVAAPAGSFRRLDGDDWETAHRVHERWADEAFAVDRTEDWWRYRVFDPPWTDVYSYGWEDDEGTLQAYLVYSVSEDDDEKVLTVHEHAYTDEEARRQVLRFCRDHDSQVGAVTLYGHRLTDLYETLTDPRAAEVTSHPAPMVRVVDVVDAVATLPVPESVEGRVVVDVTDDRCAWNDRSFAIEFAEGGATATPLLASAADEAGSTDEVGSTDEAAAVSLDVASFSQLLTGCLPLERLRTHDDVTVTDEAGATTLAAAYPEERTFLRERF